MPRSRERNYYIVNRRCTKCGKFILGTGITLEDATKAASSCSTCGDIEGNSDPVHQENKESDSSSHPDEANSRLSDETTVEDWVNQLLAEELARQASTR